MSGEVGGRGATFQTSGRVSAGEQGAPSPQQPSRLGLREARSPAEGEPLPSPAGSPRAPDPALPSRGAARDSGLEPQRVQAQLGAGRGGTCGELRVASRAVPAARGGDAGGSLGTRRPDAPGRSHGAPHPGFALCAPGAPAAAAVGADQAAARRARVH